MVDTTRYKEWLEKANQDLTGAKILFEHGADLGLVCFHCQQTVEKYFKGYLIYKTGMLQDGHNLVKLCKKSSEFSQVFKKFLKECAFINTFYIETRYPAEDPLTVSKEDVEECLKITEKIIETINNIISKSNSI